MTTHFPDVSNYQSGLSLAGAAACIAKATEGTTFRDREYANFKAQALVMGIPFAAYHWLHAADIPGQARNAFSVVGPSVPLMIDDEDTGDGLSVDRTLTFVREYRALGGTVTLEYLPKWFWSGHGSPDLRPLANAGLSIVSSNYTTYSDTGPGWTPYGGVAPAIWQYTSSQPFNGQNVDFNAYKGSVQQLRALFNGTEEDGMAWLTDERQETLFWRVEALQTDRPTVYAGATAGEPNRQHEALEDIKARLSKLEEAGGIDVAELAAALVADPGFKAAIRAELDKTKLAGA